MSSPSGPELDSRGLHTAGRGGHLSDGQGFSAWATSGRAQEKVPQRLKETTIWKSAVSQAPAASTAVSEVPGDGSSGQREEKAEEPRVEPLPPEWWESSSPEQESSVVVDWLQTSPGGTGVFRCSMAQAISRSCTGRPLIPGCSSESGWAKGDMRTASQRAVPGPEGIPCGSDRTERDSGEYVPVHVQAPILD
ncbi:uncharacterized protein [Ovis canadensis]|uniref:uncharacterized protein isoform X1 n=1 Tax=Ovis canadensis TaxID=37174 RepID=UPI00375206CB